MLLRAKDKEHIIRLAAQTLRVPVEIWAYGSRVDGSAHDASDLDLVLRRDDLSKIDWRQLAAFREVLQDSTIPLLVQVVDWAAIPETFRHNILARYEVLGRLPNDSDS